MKLFIVLGFILVLASSLFTQELTEKYSIEIINEGQEGTQPNKGDAVEMHYKGELLDGKVFDSSFERGSPLPLKIGSGQVIVCWDEVGLFLNIGATIKVLCPAATAYGSRAIGPIPADSDLIFTIERVK